MVGPPPNLFPGTLVTVNVVNILHSSQVLERLLTDHRIEIVREVNIYA